MLKKAREARDAAQDAGTADSSKSVLESSRQIWLAGLGAFSRAQAEGMKVFESLVKQGEAVETKTRQAASDTASAARHAAQVDGTGGAADGGRHVGQAGKGVRGSRRARAVAARRSYADRRRAPFGARRRACGSGERAHQVERRHAGRSKPRSSVERMVKGAVSTATRTATSAAGAVTQRSAQRHRRRVERGQDGQALGRHRAQGRTRGVEIAGSSGSRRVRAACGYSRFSRSTCLM